MTNKPDQSTAGWRQRRVPEQPEDSETADPNAAGADLDANVSSSMVKIMLGNVGMMGLSVFTGVITARILEPSGRGELAAIASLVLYIALAGSLGNWTGLSRVEATDPKRSNEVVGAAALGVVVLGSLTIGLAQLLLPLLFREQSAELLSAGRWLVLFIIPAMMFEAENEIFVGRQRFGRVSLDRFVRPLIHAVGIGILFVTDNVTVSNVFIAVGTSYFVVGAAGFFSLIRESGIAWPQRDIINRSSHFGSRIFGGIMSQKSNHELDLMVMPALVGPEIIGIYVVAVSAAAIVSGGFSHLRQLVFGLVSRDESGDATEVIEFTGRLTLLGASVVAFVLWVLAPFLINLVYGQDFAESVGVLRILLPGVVALVLAEVLFGALASLDKPLWATYASLVGLIGTLVGIAFAVRPYGATGAAVTSTIAYIMMMSAALWFLGKLGIRASRLFSPKLIRQDVQTLVGALRSRGSSAT